MRLRKQISDVDPLAQDLADLRSGYLCLLAGVGLAAGWLAAMRFLSYDRHWERTWPLLILTVGSSCAALVLRGRRTPLAAAVVALCLTFAVVLEASLSHSALALSFLPGLMVLIAGTSLPLSLACGALALVGLHFLAQSLPPAEGALLPFALLCLLTTTAASAAAARQFLAAFSWARSAARRASRAAAEAQRRREEAVKAATALRNAYYLLKRTNHALALAQAELLQARQLKTEFVNTVSHELRAPLNYILGFSELMVKSPEVYGNVPWPPGLREDLEEIYKSSSHLTRLIDDILDLAQIEAHRLSLSKELVSLPAIAQEAADMVRPWAERKGLRFVEEYAADLPPLYLDRTRIRQVILNLLNNAIRFTERGTIAIKVTRQGDQALIQVQDTGPGIPPEKLSSIFEEFVQLDMGNGRPVGGSGLGLAISRRFVQLHGGHIWAESTPGQGSTFSVSLPLVEGPPMILTGTAAQQPAYWETLQRQGLAQELVLAVGNDGLASLLREELEAYDVQLATPESVQRLVDELRPKAVIIDGQIPSSEDLLKAALSSTHDVPVISLPALERLPAQPPGAQLHLAKPVTRGKLLEAIQRVAPEATNVLVVDDDPRMQRFLKAVLGSAPARYEVLLASDTTSAMQFLLQEQVDLILLDLMLPGRSGFELLRELRAQEPFRDLPVITISAYISPSEEEPDQPQLFCIARRGWFGREQVAALLRAALQELSPRFSWGAPAPERQAPEGA